MKTRLSQLISNRDWQGMQRLLGGMSNMEFRRMETHVRTVVMPSLDNDLFWEALLHLIIFKRAAFITGVLAIEHLVKNNTLNFDNDSTKQLADYLKRTNPESLTKLANMMLPLLSNEQQINSMFSALHKDDEIGKLAVLLKVDSPLSYYLIFKNLKMLDDHIVVRKCCMALMKRKSDMAFNAVSLMKTYWDLDDMPARFSLNIEEYELNHIDKNFDTFCNVLYGKRPKI